MTTTMSGVAAIGGGVASFASSSAMLALGQFDVLPPFDYEGSHLMAKCAVQAKTRHQVERHEFQKTLDQANKRYEKSSRRGALFCRSGTWLEILDHRTAVYEARRHNHAHPQYIRGTRSQNSSFSVLEFLSVAFGLVSIRGVESELYLCMDRDGKLYGARQDQYSAECVFMEEMLENYYNLYSSCAYGWSKRPWYVALRRSGRPRKGKNARKRKKSSHFLVVHFDGSPFGSRYKYAHEKSKGVQMSRDRLRQEHSGYAKGSAWYEHFLNRATPTESTLPALRPPDGVSLDDVLLNTLNVRRSARTTYNVFENERRYTDRRRLNARRREELNGDKGARRQRRRRRRKERLLREHQRRKERQNELDVTTTTRAQRLLL
ncbi:hypothetical protein L596_025658 [Steinernema carpocapsae]|uniref:FGF n=1 Tax=Steinernema carpocapsae TaxID=34508 RepID=A0A4U5M8E4_STECR|nr:hypothetical protein L596_025658 [Steinernema carpocapsae]